MPLPTTAKGPDFVLMHGREYEAALKTGCSTCIAIMLLICAHSTFKDGWFLGSYLRFQELLTPPKPERGPRPKGPSRQEVRTAIDKLIAAGVLWRDASNLHNKQLKLRVWPREVKAASADLTNSYLNRAEKKLHQAFTRPARRSKRETKQLSEQGYQQLNSYTPTPSKNESYPQGSTAKATALTKIGDLLASVNRPPKGGAAGGATR